MEHAYFNIYFSDTGCSRPHKDLACIFRNNYCIIWQHDTVPIYIFNEMRYLTRFKLVNYISEIVLKEKLTSIVEFFIPWDVLNLNSW